MSRRRRGRSEINSLRNRMAAALDRADKLGRTTTDTELAADHTKYLCVLLSGLVETIVAEIIYEYCDKRGLDPRIRSHLVAGVDKLQNVKARKLCDLVRSFDKQWALDLDQYLAGNGRKDALDSTVELRNKIAHGESVPNLSLFQLEEYHLRVEEVLGFLESKYDV